MLHYYGIILGMDSLKILEPFKKRVLTVLDENKKSEAIREQMLAVVSHDIKNPLSIIQLEAQMIIKLADCHGPESNREKIKIQAQRILKTSERMKQLISDILDRHQVQDGLSSLHKKISRLSDLIKDVIDYNGPLIKQKSLSVDFDCAYEEEIAFDSNKMVQVISNLLSNAIKFSPPSGKIKIKLFQNEENLIFSISDQGPGIKKSELPLVFQKYWNGGVNGCSETGLGLFICKTIIEAHKGQIHVDNIEGEGATFTFSIPFDYREGQKNWIKDRIRKILVIDDDEDLRDVICWALERAGHSVHGYGNPQEAIEGLEQGRHDPKLIIVDFKMDELNGFEFIKAKRQIHADGIADCPVMIISASADCQHSMKEGEDLKEILTKPLDLEALLEKVSYLTTSIN